MFLFAEIYYRLLAGEPKVYYTSNSSKVFWKIVFCNEWITKFYKQALEVDLI